MKLGTVRGIAGDFRATSSAAFAALVAARNRRRSSNGNPHPHLVHLRSMCC